MNPRVKEAREAVRRAVNALAMAEASGGPTYREAADVEDELDEFERIVREDERERQKPF